MDIKMLVISCNSISAVALAAIRNELRDIPVVGMITPAARAATAHTASKRIGVIGAEATIASKAYTQAIANIDPTIKTFEKACPMFVPLAEGGLVDADVTQRAALRYLEDLMHLSIDCLILGSTHYRRLLEIIQSTVGAPVQIIDSAFWVTKEAKSMLNAVSARNGASGNGKVTSTFYVTEVTNATQQIAADFLRSNELEIKKLIL
jgi:glutamate racemase